MLDRCQHLSARECARQTNFFAYRDECGVDALLVSRDDRGFGRERVLDLGLTDRVAIIAAASRGLGRAVAEELAREGARVAICARTRDAVEQAALEMQQSTHREVFHQALDVTDSGAVSRFVAAVEARFGHIDICITNPRARRLRALETRRVARCG